MENKKIITVNMTFPALRDFVFRSYYGRISGMVSVFLGILAIGIMLMGLGKISTKSMVCYIAVAVICLIFNPVSLVLKTKRQLISNPFYKAPITYEIDLAGITIIQGDQKELVQWKSIYRIRYTDKMLAVYTGPYNAFVMPVSELGADKSVVVSRIVQYSLPYKPHLSGNLKEFRNDKDLSKNF